MKCNKTRVIDGFLIAENSEVITRNIELPYFHFLFYTVKNLRSQTVLNKNYSLRHLSNFMAKFWPVEKNPFRFPIACVHTSSGTV